MKILVTGSAGFIGYHLSARLLQEGFSVVGVDCLNDYYDVRLKEDRLKGLLEYDAYAHYNFDLQDQKSLDALFASHDFAAVVHLAAQAGVRYSMVNPGAYIDSNITGFMHMLESSRKHRIPHLIYASSSSVYGANVKMPFSTTDAVNHPVSLYAATKKANELMAHTYSHLYGLPTTGLRFFTVYGPWGRPDMAYFSFTKAIMEGKPIQVFNEGQMMRDFTYIDDIVQGIVRLLFRPPVHNDNWNRMEPDPSSSYAPYKIYNIGNNRPIPLMKFIHTIEECLGKEAVIEFKPMQPGDVQATYADIDELAREVGFTPKISIETGIKAFTNWYCQYYREVTV
ncbi:capsular biosynthesis protein CpsI [Paenibacillus elgii]|uniref:Capsular biosynthesis protein CpsI n=1 Tax=Paenibacillus elgii TaxID=189691 RepID=A0A163WFA7_9BACL|nr:NAD-dependent epimerase [Paenibacillus elgii]KZE76276.1 capsular biosynthesis protein CpsI [Paenibacillus elgii]MCM3268860.1 NAD-dependent epimerase [Paenibacillus elgii]